MQNTTPRRLVARLSIVAGLVVCLAGGSRWLSTMKVYAQQEQTAISGEWVLALAQDETLRVIGVSNPWARVTQGGELTFRVLTADGTSLFASNKIDVAHGTMAFADVPRNALNDPGDPPTYRLQVRVVFRAVLRSGAQSGDFAPLAEVYNSVTGATTQRTGPIADVLYSAAGNSADVY